ncbi:MAG: hypothetical protein AAGE43_04560 [Pseudomonadota bacterium]
MLAVILLALSAGVASTASADSKWSWGDSSKWTKSDYTQGWQSYSSSARHWAKKWKKAKRKFRRNSRYSDRINQLRWSNMNSGVCDELKGSSRGLRMLCIAFCELQTCTPDFTLEDPLANCSTSSKWLHARYEKRRGAGDPAMPCVKAPPENIVDCPCWTGDELANLRGLPETGTATTACVLDDGNGTTLVNNDYWFLMDDDISGPRGQQTFLSAAEFDVGRGSATCLIQDNCSDGGCLNDSRYLNITTEQASACQAQLVDAAAQRGLSCQ